MALPPYLMTTVWPWNRVIHGRASRSTAAFSWAASTRSVETWSAVVMRRPPILGATVEPGMDGTLGSDTVGSCSLVTSCTRR